MTIQDIAALRLTNERLVGSPLKNPQDVVGLLTAVQAQDYSGAKWALAQRVSGMTDIGIDALFDEGKILRTHVMRPTWHFVLPEDIVWLQMLTSLRVHAVSAYYYRKMELDDGIFRQVEELLASLLQGNRYATRAEIQQELEQAGIKGVGLRLAYVLMHAELEGHICSGPRKGKQFTYALLSERAPHAKRLGREQALAELTSRYFTSHGPAQAQDFAWWSGLSAKDVTAGIAMAKLQKEEVEGKIYWFAQSTPTTFTSPMVRLLPNYDEYLIAYKDHTPTLDASILKNMSVDARNVVFTNHIVVLDGRVVGGWRRTLTSKTVTLTIRLLVEFSDAQRAALESQAAAYGVFLGLKPIVTYI